MKWTVNWMVVAVAMFGLVLWVGCGPGTSGDDDHVDHADEDHDGDGHDADGHDDSDGGHPEHGPNGGHIVKFDCEGYHAEWVEIEADGEAKGVLVIMLDEKKEELSIAAASKVTIETMPGDLPSQTFELLAVNSNDNARASRFQSNDEKLPLNIKVADVDAKGKIMLTVEIDGKPCQAELVPHAH